MVRRAAAANLTAIALTDHDSVAGVTEAVVTAADLGLRVVSGCEFSVAAPWGEMHVLGYFIPLGHAGVEEFLERCRADRLRRAREIVEGLQAWGVDITADEILAEANGAAIGRPHVARVLVRRGTVPTMDEAFQQFLGRGRPAFVEKVLPTFKEVANLVHGVGGIVSAAHLRERASRSLLIRLKDEGLDAVETRHPSHSPDHRSRITDIALSLNLLRTGGSDWHGGGGADNSHSSVGSEMVPLEWLDAMDTFRAGLISP